MRISPINIAAAFLGVFLLGPAADANPWPWELVSYEDLVEGLEALEAGNQYGDIVRFMNHHYDECNYEAGMVRKRNPPYGLTDVNNCLYKSEKYCKENYLLAKRSFAGYIGIKLGRKDYENHCRLARPDSDEGWRIRRREMLTKVKGYSMEYVYCIAAIKPYTRSPRLYMDKCEHKHNGGPDPMIGTENRPVPGYYDLEERQAGIESDRRDRKMNRLVDRLTQPKRKSYVIRRSGDFSNPTYVDPTPGGGYIIRDSGNFLKPTYVDPY